ncbi:hypothetical protein KBC75_02365 [Candidatus Shapirobacteria bacterium]|nr:hypothetical protein [Candidatus Shapirobacteria bacterium]
MKSKRTFQVETERVCEECEAEVGTLSVFLGTTVGDEVRARQQLANFNPIIVGLKVRRLGTNCRRKLRHGGENVMAATDYIAMQTRQVDTGFVGKGRLVLKQNEERTDSNSTLKALKRRHGVGD